MCVSLSVSAVAASLRQCLHNTCRVHCRHTRVLEMAVPEHAHVSFASEAPYYGFRNGVHCFKRAVLLGANMFGFPDMITAFEFRQRAYAHLGLVQPNTTATTSNRRVVLLDRHRGAARRFHNARDMLALIRGLGVHVEHVVVTVNTTFEEQVRLMASTGVLVSMHGAGLMNQIFLPPGAAVIEVFPVNFKHVLYERIAHYMGVYHFKVRFAVCCVCGAHTHTHRCLHRHRATLRCAGVLDRATAKLWRAGRELPSPQLLVTLQRGHG